jgi:hypothetical protein
MFPGSAKLNYNLGRTLERLGRPGEAADAFRRYLARAPDAEDRANVEGLIARLEERTLTAELVLSTQPPGAGASWTTRPRPAPRRPRPGCG